MNKALLCILCISWFLPRFIHIKNPILGVHAWRQSDTAAIARNFHREGNSILEPRIDWRENKIGLVETEFQIFPFVISILYSIFGESEGWGRVLALLIATLGLFYFFCFIKELYGYNVAFIASILYSILPTSIYYSRAIMPEALVLTCIVGSLFHFHRFLKECNWKDIILFALWIGLLGTIKFFHFYIGLALIFMAFEMGKHRVLLSKRVWSAIFFVILATAVWWWRAHLNYIEGGFTFGIWGEKQDKILNWDLLVQIKYWDRILVEWIAKKHFASLLVIPFALFFLLSQRFRDVAWIRGYLVGFFIFLAVVVLGNFVHEYYSLSLLIPACAAAALVLDYYAQKSSRAKVVVLVFIVGVGGFSFSIYQNEYYNKELSENSIEFRAAEKLREVTQYGQLVAVALNSYNPNIHYLSDRKGCRLFIGQLFEKLFVQELINRGCSVFVTLKSEVEKANKGVKLGELVASNRVLYDSSDFVIFAFNNP